MQIQNGCYNEFENEAKRIKRNVKMQNQPKRTTNYALKTYFSKRTTFTIQIAIVQLAKREFSKRVLKTKT